MNIKHPPRFVPPNADILASLIKYRATVFDSIASTNTELINAIKAGTDETEIFAAVSQTSGRGRLGRSFSSEYGGIYFSFNFSMPTSRAAQEARLVTPLAGVAVTSALASLYGIDVGLKWVNDIIANGKKLGGILSEAVTIGDKTHITVGIGINAVNSDFPDTATALSRVCAPEVTEFDANAVIAETVREFFARLLCISDIYLEYKPRIVHLGKPVRLHRFDGTEDTNAVALDVNENCELIVRDENGNAFPISSGEVSIIIKNQ